MTSVSIASFFTRYNVDVLALRAVTGLFQCESHFVATESQLLR